MNAVTAVSAFIVNYWYIFAGIYVIMSVITFIAFADDKKKSKSGAWRTRESTLILLSFLFGSLGAYLGMKIFRHKTQHLKFQILVPLSLLLHIFLAALVIWFGLLA